MIVYEHPRTDAPLSGIMRQIQAGGAFMREELVAKRYLCAKDCRAADLEYYLLVSPLAEDLGSTVLKLLRGGVE